ncbi:MAG TPA: HD domain-containing phosphohydrolase [Dehalococcoidia bacterium]|nr:HD domain-containing phosphohydrolase [Dehalococcoidia bacterium]
MNGDEVKVLLVDDNPDDVSIMRRLLGQYERTHFEVSSASTTGNCLALLEADGVDLLFLDYAMPGEDGIAFLRRAAGVVDLPPVIIITGSADYRLIAEAIRWGASDCVYKNAMTSHTLGMAAQQALAKSRHEIELSRYDQHIITALVRTSADVDPTTGGPRLAALAETLGRGLELNDHQVQLLGQGALLHDVGKLGVRSELIMKPGPLTEEEYEEVRLHPLIGERLCAPLRLSRELGPIIRHHHERWDGKGYVDGLAGDEIPLLARVISVVDAFDAMTTNRPYRAALSETVALGRLHKGAGTQWDPEVVEVFLEQMDVRQLAA